MQDTRDVKSFNEELEKVFVHLYPSDEIMQSMYEKIIAT